MTRGGDIDDGRESVGSDGRVLLERRRQELVALKKGKNSKCFLPSLTSPQSNQGTSNIRFRSIPQRRRASTIGHVSHDSLSAWIAGS